MKNTILIALVVAVAIITSVSVSVGPKSSFATSPPVSVRAKTSASTAHQTASLPYAFNANAHSRRTSTTHHFSNYFHEIPTEQLIDGAELSGAELCGTERNDVIEQLRQLAEFVAPSDARLVSCLFDLYMLAELPALALEIMKKAVQLVPGDRELKIKLAEAQSANGYDAEAEKVILSELVDDPTNIQALEAYQTILRNMGRHNEFFAHLQGSIQSFPENTELYVQLATAQRENANPEGAVETLRRGLLSVPNDLVLLRVLADHLSILGRYEESAILYRQIMENNMGQLRLDILGHVE